MNISIPKFSEYFIIEILVYNISATFQILCEHYICASMTLAYIANVNIDGIVAGMM